MYTKEMLLQNLRSREVLVDFVKKNGERRIMRCTKNSNVIPEDKQPKGLLVESESADNIRVFDLEKSEWRSFNWGSVVAVDAEVLV